MARDHPFSKFWAATKYYSFKNLFCVFALKTFVAAAALFRLFLFLSRQKVDGCRVVTTLRTLSKLKLRSLAALKVKMSNLNLVLSHFKLVPFYYFLVKWLRGMAVRTISPNFDPSSVNRSVTMMKIACRQCLERNIWWAAATFAHISSKERNSSTAKLTATIILTRRQCDKQTLALQ